jgi:hypothetical protein
MNLVLSPTLYRICKRSKSFRINYRYSNLNVCNVIRSLLFVILVWDVLVPAAGVFLLDVTAKVPFTMVVAGTWNPFDALDIINDATVSKANFDTTNFFHWWTVFSVILTTLITLVLAVFACAATIALGVFLLWLGVKYAFKGKKPAGHVAELVLGPLEVVGEYLESKHNKVCLKIEAKIAKTYAEKLHEEMADEKTEHAQAIRRMTKAQLLESIECNRSILAKYA